ncbi:Carnitinyl-CoA dehydratase [Mycobacteroides salmoniphilum]|uniref:Carnitinyl-CoA dehydratase n=1 Tax=Mycobacteroides salmoniphilum TaxID=404941 RepID=A0A4R8RVI6_9MYCO|nr:crotonase/enoyl-CoA hydratase family protein [Mycobacteroides salmoniphilum]TDZ76498.1 Carnitinyl-CoA dehydratase [Mycobacteroides salmoniphilum]TDZ78483.1 Carnitinyl-CoA dehydratase [Mycobacteroides salmoniphilum]TDZ85016.1 Carnitinyl-CoA dehydratase [Mycobacteroides salmoniphilum]
MADEVLIEQRDRVLLITINRPDARNAVNRAVSQGLAAAADQLDSSDELSVAILTGAGGNFCAGMDLKAFVSGEAVLSERGLGFTNVPPRKPIIAAVEGFALAGGTELVLSCDLVVAGRSAKFGIPEVKRGLVAGAGGLLRLPNRIPYQVAMELALTGDSFTAEDAAKYGFINRLVDDGQALDTALELAAKITANGPLAVAATKRIIIESASWAPEQAFVKQGEILMPIFVSEDAREGAKAFAEKRAPVWKGK